MCWDLNGKLLIKRHFLESRCSWLTSAHFFEINEFMIFVKIRNNLGCFQVLKKQNNPKRTPQEVGDNWISLRIRFIFILLKRMDKGKTRIIQVFYPPRCLTGNNLVQARQALRMKAPVRVKKG